MPKSSISYVERTVAGRRVRLSGEDGKPLLLLVRMAAHDMGLWDEIWTQLAEVFTLASFNLSVSDFSSRTPRDVLDDHARECIEVAQGLGHERFHLLGWSTGAMVALRLALDFPGRLLSLILMGAILEPDERGPTEFFVRILQTILRTGDLEFYTYYWLLSGLTPQYVEEHFDEITALVQHRLKIDKNRFDSERVLKWVNLQRTGIVTESDLAQITVPTLIAAPAYAAWPPLHVARRLAARIPNAELAVIPGGGDLVLLEDPDAFMIAAGPFMHAVAAGRSRPALWRERDALRIDEPERRAVLVDPAPSDEAIVFLHGWLMSPEIWVPAIDALRGRHRCIAPWQPGHGASTAAPIGFTMADWADWLASALDAVGVRRATLVGHSMGGMLAMAFLDRYPERTRALALVSTQATAWDEKERHEFIRMVDPLPLVWGPEVVLQIAEVLLGEDFLDRDAGWLGRWTHAVARYDLPGQTYLGRAIGSRPDYVARLRASDVPLLIVHGSEDEAIEPEIARALAVTLPRARYVELADCGHCPPLEKPDRFVQALLDFVA